MCVCVQIAGAGSAGIGVASMLLQGMVEQGMNRDRAKKNFWVCDKDGLLGQARKDVRLHMQAHICHPLLFNSHSSTDVWRAPSPSLS